MTTRYYEITECPHGKVDPHWYDDWKSPPKVRTHCPGGQRRELIGYTRVSCPLAEDDWLKDATERLHEPEDRSP